MGGHADGARAAEVALQAMVEAFWHTPQPLFDPLGFLHLGLGRAHEEVVCSGCSLPIELRPRATFTVCVVQQGASLWAHVGDSRIYHRARAAQWSRAPATTAMWSCWCARALISAEQAHNHPMRNFVECCLGGDPMLPEMTITRRRRMRADDVLLVCTDGFWGSPQGRGIGSELGHSPAALARQLLKLGGRRSSAPAPAAITPRLRPCAGWATRHT